VYGLSNSPNGRGVYGVAVATSGVTYGGWFESAGPNGRGVYGVAVATSGVTYGGWFESASPNGTGVLGWTTATSGAGIGVYGLSNSTNGTGVFGWATATGGITYGGWFESASPDGRGVFGWASATSGVTYGGRFQSDSSAGYGVYGFASANSGTNYGVFGRSDSSAGYGVYGFASANSGTNIGVYGGSNSPDGFGGYFVGRGYFGYNSTLTNATLRLHETEAEFARLEFTNTNTARKWHIAGFIGATQAADRLNIWNSAAGDILSVRGDGTVAVRVLEITGADLAEKFPVSEPDIEPGMVVEIDPDQPGNLRLARGAYNRRVVGVVAGANGLSKGIVLGNLEGSDHHAPIAISGRVWVYADATEQAIEPGDFLTTAARPGYAMKANDLRQAQGAIIGKAMTRLEKGKTGLVLVIVNLQ
jgi:hypothetical protein